MAEYINVGKVSDFEEGVIRGFVVNGKDVAVVNWRNRFYAFQNRCTHAGFSFDYLPLTCENEILCHAHYAVFELATGEAIRGPTRAGLPVYSVRVEDENVLVGLD